MTTLGTWLLAHLRSDLERHDRRIPAGTQRTHYQEKTRPDGGHAQCVLYHL
jgi:hypothetical protein